jgi:WD repeat-containing protein 76
VGREGLNAQSERESPQLEYVSAAAASGYDWNKPRKEGPLDLEALIRDVTDQDLPNVERLAGMMAAEPQGTEAVAGDRSSRAADPGAAVLEDFYSSLRIREESHVAKVTPERVYSCCFTSRSDLVVMWAGDKAGNVGAFRPLDEGFDTGENDTLMAPHSRAVASIVSPTPRPEWIITASYDHSVRVFDAIAMRSIEAVVWDELIGYACPSTNVGTGGENAQVLWAVTFSGELLLTDLRVPRGALAPSSSSSSSEPRPKRIKSESSDGPADAAAPPAPAKWDIHDMKCCAVDVHPSLPLVLTASNDTTARLWDARMLLKSRSHPKKANPLAELAHGRGCSSAFFSGDGTKIVSTANDDYIRVWQASTSKLKDSFTDPPFVQVAHDNHTGKWLSNFRTVFEPLGGGQLVLVGAMGSRHLQMFSARTGRLLFDKGDDLLTAVPTINAFHPSLPYVCSTTASGRLHLWS